MTVGSSRRSRAELLLERRTSSQAGGGRSRTSCPCPGIARPDPGKLLADLRRRGGAFSPSPSPGTAGRRVYPEGGIDLLDSRPDGQDVIQITLVPKTGDPERDRLAADPVQQKKLLEDEWKKQGEMVLPGPAGWLPDAEWSPLKRKVYRFEAALVPADDSAGARRRAGGSISIITWSSSAATRC